MTSLIAGMVRASFQAVQNWLAMIFHATGTLGVYLGIIVVWLSLRYLVSPLLFTRGSDKVKKKKDGDV